MNMYVATPSSVGAAAVLREGRKTRSLCDDRELLRLCRRAMAALKREAEITQHYMAALDVFEAKDPPRPLVPNDWKMIPDDRHEHLSSAAMRKEMKRCRDGWHAEKVVSYRERIARVAAWEKLHAVLDRATGMSRLDAAQTRAIAAVRAAVEPIVDLRPATVDGLLAKAAVFTKACGEGFTSADEPFDRLAWAIASDVIAVAALRKSH